MTLAALNTPQAPVTGVVSAFKLILIREKGFKLFIDNGTIFQVVGANGERIKVQTTEGATKKKTKWWKAKYPLPYWCAYVAWILAIACTVASMLFVILYSLQWGKEKADGWLSTLLLSMAQSVVLVQPIKVRSTLPTESVVGVRMLHVLTDSAMAATVALLVIK